MKIACIIETIIYKVIGVIFLTPPIIGVYFFFAQLLSNDLAFGYEMKGDAMRNWCHTYAGTGGSINSPFTFYFGLMAIAGVIIITKKAETKS